MMNQPHQSCDCNCADAYSVLAELLDGDCSPASRAQLRSQIESCPHCFEQLGVEEEIRELLRRSCATSAPIELRQRITFSIRVERNS